jgi:hypothetical protein
MPDFFKSFWEKLQARLAEAVLVAIAAVLFTGGSNWLWRVYHAEPTLARLSTAIAECGTSRRCDELHRKVDDLESRLSRIEGKLSK